MDNTASRRNAKLIKDARSKKKVSVRKLGEMIDVSPSTISRWEINEKTVVTEDMVNKVYKALGLESPFEIMEDVLSQTQEPLYEYRGRGGMYLLQDNDDDRPKKYSIKTLVPFGSVTEGAILDVNSDLFLRNREIVHADLGFRDGMMLDGIFEYEVVEQGVKFKLLDDSKVTDDNRIDEGYTDILFESVTNFNLVVHVHGVVEGYYVNLRTWN